MSGFDAPQYSVPGATAPVCPVPAEKGIRLVRLCDMDADGLLGQHSPDLADSLMLACYEPVLAALLIPVGGTELWH